MHWTEEEYQAYLDRQQRPSQRAATDHPEAAFLHQVRALAKHAGYLVYHTRDSRGSDEGFPDLILVSPERVIFAELKTRTGKLTVRQAVCWRCSGTRATWKSTAGGLGIGQRLSIVWAGPHREWYGWQPHRQLY